jgi:hypothetical protein
LASEVAGSGKISDSLERSSRHKSYGDFSEMMR